MLNAYVSSVADNSGGGRVVAFTYDLALDVFWLQQVNPQMRITTTVLTLTVSVALWQ